MEIVFSRSFRKALAKLSKRQQDLVEAAVTCFGENRADPALRDHALKGRLQGLRAFSAAWNLRVIYREEGGFITIILVDVGTHSQVY